MFTITLSSQEKCLKFKQKYQTRIFSGLSDFKFWRVSVLALIAVGVFSLAFPREQNGKLVKSKRTKKEKKLLTGY